MLEQQTKDDPRLVFGRRSLVGPSLAFRTGLT